MTAGSLAELGTPRLLQRLWRELRPLRRRQFALVSVAMATSALAEVVTLGAVIPFIAVLVEPERVLRYRPVAELAQIIGISQPEKLAIPLALLFIAGAMIAAAIRLIVVWSTTRLSVAIGADLSSSIYERILYQPYLVHIEKNTSEAISVVINKVETIVGIILIPLQTAISAAFIILSVTIALFLIDPVVAVISFSFIGAGYVAISRALSARLASNSIRIAREQVSVIKAVQEGLGGIREVLLNGTQMVFLEKFRRADRPVRHAQGSNTVIHQVPRVVMEGVALIVVSLLVVILSGRPGGIVSGLPVLGALALGGQRLLPLFQQCYGAVVSVLGNRDELGDALEVLEQPMPADHGHSDQKALHLDNALECRQVRFRYPSGGPWVVDDLNLTIHKGSRVGLVGTTGCGKTTLLDLITGLLSPTQGTVLIDDEPLVGGRVEAWQQSVAYVPQQVYLADASLTENIAFGVPADQVDMEKVEWAAQRALVTEFIEDKARGLGTVVGERGVRLSGGQRQRIGIARAFYRDASFLVFDEATSALDNQTELEIIKSLAGLDRGETLLVVAHRLSSLRGCDVIIEMGQGRIVAQGTYECLMSESATFREMASTGGIER